MKIYKLYFETLRVKETNWDDTISRLEGSGYYKPDTVKKLLSEGEILRNPYALYSCDKEKLENLI